MKKLKYLFVSFLILALPGCADDENDTGFIDNVDAPSSISALFTITQDNTGRVTITPSGSGATQYEINFGDGSQNESFAAGESAEHVYAEGVYNVVITARGINGLETEYSQQLTVSFVAPQNLAVSISPQSGNPYQVNVEASADYETFFEVYFGEDPGETPVQFNEGQVVSHEYSAIGDYEIRVVAYSGGAATSEYTETITIFDPILLPVNFESATLNYVFGDFGGTFASVANNPEASAANPSAKVGKLTKNAGAEVWAGTTLLLDAPIDFSTMQTITIKSYSTVVGAAIKFKLENMSDANINIELDAVTTVANDWETLTYDFSGINNANNYQRIAIFYDFGNVGTGADYYFDDITLTSGTPQIELPLTFENAALAYSFANFGGATSTLVNNPDQSGINTSSKVGQLVKNVGSEVWAGSVVPLDVPINFSTLQKIKIKVWSPQAGIPVLLKLENAANATIFVEQPQTTTVANAWEELTYDFTGINNANNYQNMVLFFDFGTNGTGATYYFDDIQLSN